MLIANFADLHARGSDLAAFRRQWEAALGICRERGVDLVTIAGDVFDKSNVHDAHASTGAIIKAVTEPMDCGLKFLVIPGNHDASGPGSPDALNVWIDGGPDVIVIRRPQWFAFDSREDGAKTFNVFCLPWQWDGGAAGILDDLSRDEFAWSVPGRKLLLAHLAVGGMPMNNGRTCEEGKTGVVSRALIESLPFDCLNIGHFHLRSPIYNGALRQCDFGEEGNPQGFVLWDTDTNAQEWVEVSEAPRHRTVEVGPGEPLPKPVGNEKLKIRPIGWRPTESETIEAERAGAKIDNCVPKPERIARASITPAEAADKEAMFLKYVGTRDIQPEPDRLAAMLNELRELPA